jgi:two-component system NarL family sensor kinase
VLLAIYGCAAVWAVVVAFSPAGSFVMSRRLQFVVAIADVATVSGFQLLSTGGFVPLLVMALLPLMVALQVSWRRAAVVLAVSAVAFVFTVLLDPVIEERLGWPETWFLFVIYGFLCCTAFAVTYLQGRHVDEIASLSGSREELLGEVMTASDAERRRISESIHDGPLQDVLAARPSHCHVGAHIERRGLALRRRA